MTNLRIVRGIVVAGLVSVGVATLPHHGASAQGLSSGDDDTTTGNVYARIGAGGLFPRQFNQDISYSPDLITIVLPPDRRESSLRSTPSVSAALGFAYPAGTRTELEYRYISAGMDEVMHTGGFDPGPGAPVSVPVTPDGDFSVHFLMSNAYQTVLGNENLSFFIGAGVGGAFTRNGFGQSDAAFAYQGRAGVSARVGDGYDMSVEYLYVRTRDLVYGPDDALATAGAIQIDGAEFISSGVTASLRKAF